MLRLRNVGDRVGRHPADVFRRGRHLLLHHADERKLRNADPADAATEGITRGIYLLSRRDAGPDRPKVQLFGSGAILREVLRAQEILEKQFDVSSNVYSVTSYKALYDDGRDCQRWNRLHPGETPRQPYVSQTLAGESGPIVAASDYVSAVPLSIAQWVPQPYTVLGTTASAAEARRACR